MKDNVNENKIKDIFSEIEYKGTTYKIFFISIPSLSIAWKPNINARMSASFPSPETRSVQLSKV